MSSSTIIWTALPNGAAAGGKLKLSVMVTPRLTGNTKTTKLSEFPAFLDWPTTLGKIQFSVRYGSATIPATVVGDKPSTVHWQALYKAGMTVNSFNFVEQTRPIHSYDVGEVYGYIKEKYAKIATDHPQVPPTAEVLTSPVYLGPIGFYGGLDTKNEPGIEQTTLAQIRSTVKTSKFLPKTPIKAADGKTNVTAARQNFAAVKNFYVGQAVPSKVPKAIPPVPPPVLDFHQQIAALGGFPYVMRHVGLVIDLEFTLPAGTPASNVVSVVVKGSPTTTDTTPKTAIVMPAFIAGADPKRNEVKNGMLDLSPPRYDVVNLDVDGAALNLMEWTTNLQRKLAYRMRRTSRDSVAQLDDVADQRNCAPDIKQNFAQIEKVSQKAMMVAMSTQAPSEPEPAPALFPAGIAVVKGDRAKLMSTVMFPRLLTLEKGYIGVGAVKALAYQEQPDVYAEDLARGYALDVWDNVTKKWHSTVQRKGTYKFLAGAPDMVDIQDEGFVQLAANNDPAAKELYAHEVIMRWSGWSLAVERPGKAQNKDGQPERISANAAKNTGTTGLQLATSFKVPAGSLPRLRYGTTYKLRARVVDLAGNTVAMDSAAANANVATSEIIYTRYNPVPTPDITYCSLPKPAESVDRLVIRSNYNTPPLEPDTRRYITPPKAPEMLAEEHGKLDGAATLTTDKNGNKTYTVITAHDGTLRDIDKNQPVGEPKQTDPPIVIPPGQLATLPFFPDPMAAGVLLRNVPNGAGAPASVSRSWDAAPNWFDAKPFQLRVVEGSAAPAWDAAGRVLTISLAKAEMIGGSQDEVTLKSVSGGDIVKAHIESGGMLISSIPDGASLNGMGVLNWMQEEKVAQAKITEIRAIATQGAHWMISPYKPITLVHAVQQPIDPPKFGTFTGGRSAGDTYATLTDPNLTVHGKSTIKVKIEGVWKEWHDDPNLGPPLQLPGRAVACEVAVLRSQTKLTLPSDAKNGYRHEFHDTKHRLITYTATGSSRFPEYFADKDLKDVDFQRASTPLDVHIPSSARPEAPSVVYIVPMFRWERSAAGTKRVGGGLRVYLDRPWYSSGDDEKLAVLLPAGGKVDPKMEPYVSLWGKDPIWSSAPARNAELTTADFPLALKGTAGDFHPVQSLIRYDTLLLAPAAAPKPAAPPATSLKSVTSGLQKTKRAVRPGVEDLIQASPGLLLAKPQMTLAELNNDPASVVEIAAHDVKYDPDRDLYYCDIEIRMPEAYTPFVRLALARYQPYAIVDCHISRVTRCDFMQLTPDRSITIANVPGGTANQVAVTFTGMTYKPVNADSHAKVVVIIEEKKADGSDNLGWTPAAGIDPVELKPDPAAANQPTSYRQNFVLPGARSNYRLTVREYEIYDGGAHRLVFADAVPLG